MAGRRALLVALLSATCAGCAPAPVESADDVRARENERVQAAERKVDEREQRENAELEARRRDEEARSEEATRHAEEDQRRKDARQSAWCASDRDTRRAHLKVAIDAARRERARAAELEAYIEKNCSKTVADDTKTEQYVDEKGYVRTRPIVVGHHDAWSCPDDAPAELRAGGSGIPSGIVKVDATTEERDKNERCQDVQDLLVDRSDAGA